MSLGQLKWTTRQLGTHTFQLGTMQNHIHQASSFIQFCDNYNLPFILPSASILCYYITHRTHHFLSARSIKNYISRVKFLYKELSLTKDDSELFPITSLLRENHPTQMSLHHSSSSSSAESAYHQPRATGPSMRCASYLGSLLCCGKIT